MQSPQNHHRETDDEPRWKATNGAGEGMAMIMHYVAIGSMILGAIRLLHSLSRFSRSPGRFK
jgi:hypothetical protein